jgi:uncharacterized membrane protein
MKHPRFVIFFLVFAATGALAAAFLPAHEALVVGFDIGAISFVASCLPIWMADSAGAIRARAARDDGSRILLLLIALIVLLSVLIAIAMMIEARSSPTAWDIATILGTLVLAWVFVNLVHAFHYAHSYYDAFGEGHVGGLVFPGTLEPLFDDFCYFAFVIGMTSQVSDVAIESRQMRRLATLHGLQAFFFNLGVLALTVNMLSAAI